MYEPSSRKVWDQGRHDDLFCSYGSLERLGRTGYESLLLLMMSTYLRRLLPKIPDCSHFVANVIDQVMMRENPLMLHSLCIHFSSAFFCLPCALHVSLWSVSRLLDSQCCMNMYVMSQLVHYKIWPQPVKAFITLRDFLSHIQVPSVN